MLKKANELLYASQFEEAVQEYQRVIAARPDKDILIAAHYNIAQAYDSMGQYANAG